ncbi:type ISP restriction/modification enzyme [Bradyrhizobium tunisiense]|uniref:type ISP restriction/modification enzyme n=1 Tax=Bradyrhizobium tunisiense TaxID=3278709 RepID=UPI0035E2D86A
MPTDHRAALARIKRFDQLIAYLRDEMGWPIARDSFENVDDLFYDFTAAELGIDAHNSAKIQEIKRLRPLSSKQPWGIFFVKFEPKNLPVVALRRILSQVALKKRSSANSAERAAWSADDLLFISNYGEGDERQISFAHFSKAQDSNDLPTLKVLGWDNLDTALHLDNVAKELTEHLAWPDDDADVEAWRRSWRAAFSVRHREVVTTSRDLSIRLAELARAIRDRIKAALDIETEEGPLTKLMKAFQEALVHDLDPDGFADMYAQTIAYGLLSARIADPEKKTTDDFAAHMRTNPFLRELMETFLHVGGRRGKAGGPGIDFDELGVSEVVELLDNSNMEAVVRDFGDRNPQEDPVIHFYELFLKEYDARKRMQRGVFYTPRSVVSYIVRSVDELLRSELGLQDGLADTVSWGEMAKRHGDLKIPEGVPASQAFVQILDPATGTGTFLVEVIDLIHRTLVAKWKAQGVSAENIGKLWNQYVPQHLLPRLHGYELMMAPYAIAHLKIGLKLYETGYRFGSVERARVYLTNALESAHDLSGRFFFAIPALAHEAQAVNEVKRKQRFTVVIGNPPYSLLSANLEPQHRALIEDYKFIDGERIRERGALQLEKNLNDDYVKFARLSQLAIERSEVGVSGLITNHSFLDNPTMRGMRWSLLNSDSCLWVNDLHGNSTKKEHAPDGGKDENLFQIKQGVAIALSVRLPGAHAPCEMKHHELWGTQESKEAWLAANSVGTQVWQPIAPTADLYLFVPQNISLKSEFEVWPSLPTAMPVNGAGYITARDNLVIDFERDVVVERVRAFNASSKHDASLLKTFDISEKKGWDVGRARKELKYVDIPKAVIKTNYRPFDSRWIFFNSTLVWGRSWPTMQHVVGQRRNLTMLATRMTKDQWDVWTARTVSSHKAMSAYDTNSVFPLYLVEEPDASQRSLITDHRINFSASFLRTLATALGIRQEGTQKLPAGQSAENIFQYIYSVFHSPKYRTRYDEFLKSDFPRIPLPGSLKLFIELAALGRELIALHLMESPKLDHFIDTYTGPKDPYVERVGWSDDAVWLDAPTKNNQAATPGTIGFRGVSHDVWNFHIGGYQVCEKWLKDRKGRTLSKADIAHYQKIVLALSETIRLMTEIDEVIEVHGGWPGAFVQGDGTIHSSAGQGRR